MNKTSLLLLILMVAGLGAGVYLQKEAEEDYDPRLVEPLLGTGRVERVTGIRVDNVERSKQIEFVRRKEGWFLVDPLEYPADHSMVQFYLQALAYPAQFVPEEEEASLDPHFDPPRAVIFVTETLESGSTVEHEIRVGDLDVDGMRLEVRTRGRSLRILRNLDTAMERSVEEMRRKMLFTLHGAEVVAIDRQGANYTPDGAVDVSFQATRGGAGWQLQRPYRMDLDPGVTGLWAMALASIRVSGFLSDREDPNLEFYGLVNPSIRVRLTDRTGKEEEVHFGQMPSNGAWVARRAGEKHIMQVDPGDLVQLLQAGRELWNTRLVNAFRVDIESVDLDRGEQDSLRFSQDFDGHWTVASKPLGQAQFDIAVPANRIKVEGLLADLEQNEIELWLDREADSPENLFPVGEPRRGLKLNLRGVLEGEHQGGRFGPTRTSDEGTTLQSYHREGDVIAGLVTRDLAAWLDLELSDWRSLALWTLTEVKLTGVSLTHGDAARSFLRKMQGTWHYSDVDAPASELLRVLDSLVFLKASEHLGAGVARDQVLEDVISVQFQDKEGATHRAKIGTVSGPEGTQVQIEVLGLRSVAKDQGLHGRLLGLFK
ncbi:MAG: hypothetical protein ACI8QC_001261 [Planctomycetota bacterium]|jgi:hypothetical protein